MNKEELKEKTNNRIDKLPPKYDCLYSEGERGAYQLVSQDIDQLDEPEKPTVPQFVAEWIEACKKDGISLLKSGHELYESNIDDSEVEEWISDGREEMYARAWLDGYTVEEEQKYYVLGKHDTPILFRDHRKRITETSNLSAIYPKADSEDFEFTEQEIKDYDERYWAFAVPVEEEEG